MKLRVIDKSNNVLDLSGYEYLFKISSMDLSTSYTVLDKAKQHGSGIVNDGFFNHRKVDLDFSVIKTSDILYQNAINAIVYFFRKSQEPFYLENWESGGTVNYRRMKIVPTGLKERFDAGLEKRLGNYTMSFVSPDGFWEGSSVLVTATNSLNWTITLPSYVIDSYFKLSYVLPSTAKQTIINVTTGRYMTLTGSTGTLIVDSRSSGEIYVNGFLQNYLIEKGSFFPLVAGSNVLNILQNDGVGTFVNNPAIEYRPRYVF